jgi:hypothetical protein
VGAKKTPQPFSHGASYCLLYGSPLIEQQQNFSQPGKFQCESPTTF